MKGYKLELEERKIYCETVKKILYGAAFDELPSVKILRCIEEDVGVTLEFKYHFRYLVPQVYGWECMEDWLEIQQELTHRSHEPVREPVNKQEELWTKQKTDEQFRASYEGLTYFEICRRLHSFGVNDFVHFDDDLNHLKHAVSVCNTLFTILDDLIYDIEQEEAYIKKEAQRETVLAEIEWQCQKMYNLYYKKSSLFTDLHDVTKDFVNNFIENKLIKCTDKTSGDDTGLENFWEEFCVQVQQEHSYLWDTYLRTLYKWICEEVKKLPNWKLNSIWLDGQKDKIERDIDNDEYAFLDDIDVEKINVEKESYYYYNEVEDFVFNEIMGAAADYSDDAIENYIEGSYEHD